MQNSNFQCRPFLIANSRFLGQNEIWALIVIEEAFHNQILISLGDFTINNSIL